MAKSIDQAKIDEALELLNEVAKGKEAELKRMISEKYGNLKSAFGGIAEKIEHRAHDTYEQGKEKAEEMASRVDGSVRKNPWPFLGGTAIGFLILGYLFGRSRK